MVVMLYNLLNDKFALPDSIHRIMEFQDRIGCLAYDLQETGLFVDRKLVKTMLYSLLMTADKYGCGSILYSNAVNVYNKISVKTSPPYRRLSVNGKFTHHEMYKICFRFMEHEFVRDLWCYSRMFLAEKYSIAVRCGYWINDSGFSLEINRNKGVLYHFIIGQEVKYLAKLVGFLKKYKIPVVTLIYDGVIVRNKIPVNILEEFYAQTGLVIKREYYENTRFMELEI